MASPCIACCIFHIISIQLNYNDDTFESRESYDRCESYNFCFSPLMFALFLEFRSRTCPQELWPFLISETRLKFLIWTQGEIGPRNRARLVNPGSCEETLACPSSETLETRIWPHVWLKARDERAAKNESLSFLSLGCHPHFSRVPRRTLARALPSLNWGKETIKAIERLKIILLDKY